MKFLVLFFFYLVAGAEQEARTNSMPCCRESIGTAACLDIKSKNPNSFKNRCQSDADFAIIQCCKSCNTNVPELGRNLFAYGIKSKHCFDRHNKKFCQQFLHQSGMWAGNNKEQMSCNGESAALAFRICRRTCGFCNPDIYDEQNFRANCPQLNSTRFSLMSPNLKPVTR